MVRLNSYLIFSRPPRPMSLSPLTSPWPPSWWIPGSSWFQSTGILSKNCLSYTISSYVHYVSSILKITLNHKINIDTHIIPDMPKFKISIPTIFLICSSWILPSISDLTCALMLEASPCTLNCIDLMVNISSCEYCFLIFCILSHSRCRTSWRWRCQVARGCSERQKSSVWRIQVDRICWHYKIWIFKRVFYRVGAPQGEFQIFMDCTYRPNDVVPIIGKILIVFLNLLQTY